MTRAILELVKQPGLKSKDLAKFTGGIESFDTRFYAVEIIAVTGKF